MKLISFALFWALSAIPVAAQHSLIAKPLRDNVYLVEGGTANAGFVVGTEGVIVIDAQRSIGEAAAQIALIRQTTSKPIVAIIITHADPDHVGGLTAYPASARVIMHENAWAQILAAAEQADRGGPIFGPMYRRIAAHRLPSQTVGVYDRLLLGGTSVEVIHVGPAHSSGDLIVYLPRQKIVYAGDIAQNGGSSLPVIHIGGSSLGWINSVRRTLALKATIIVPGHGPVLRPGELAAQMKDTERHRTAIKEMVGSGKTLEQIDAALPSKNVYPMFPSFNRTTYDELTKGYPAQVPPWDSFLEPLFSQPAPPPPGH